MTRTGNEQQPERSPPSFNLVQGRTALLVIDMQNGFLDPKGSCARLGLDHTALRRAIPGVQKLLEVARSVHMPTIFTRYVYRSDYIDGGIVVNLLLPGLREARSLEAGSWDAEIAEEVNPTLDEMVIDKNRPSAFYCTPMRTYLDGLGINSLIVCGITTNICVETTVRDAMHRDYRTWVVADAAAEFELDRHEHALNSMAWMFAAIVDLEQALKVIPGLVASSSS